MPDFNIAPYVSHIEANRSIKDAVMEKLRSRRPPYRVTVTDLTNLKQAYFKRKHPEITPPLEKQQLMWKGTGFHKIFGFAVSSEEYLEQFVEAEGIVGKIDIYENVPVEVKTTSPLAKGKSLLQQRPTYIEQVGMYCALVNVGEGEIVIYERQGAEESKGVPLTAYHVAFPDLEAVREEMRHRRDLLIQALISNDPSNLPVCAWFGRGCDYSAVCDCSTRSVSSSHKIAELAGKVQVDEVTRQRLLDMLGKPKPPQQLRTNDLVFPRKAYFERRKSQEAISEDELAEEKGESLRSMDEMGFAGALKGAIQFGSPGEVENTPVQYASLSDLVRLRQGLPTMVRISKFQSLVERGQLPSAFPHYFYRLGFDCALIDRPKGRLFLYYANVSDENAKMMVYDVSFRNLGDIKAEALRRVELLEKATSPAQLPRCPSWLCRYCSYKDECGEI
jgi:hypothetical protein